MFNVIIQGDKKYGIQKRYNIYCAKHAFRYITTIKYLVGKK